MFEVAASTAGGGSSMLLTYGPFILIFALIYFVMIRPNQKRQKTRTQMLNSLKKGDKIVTIGGIHGTIQEMTDDQIVLRVNDTSRMTFERSAISSIKEKNEGSE